MNLIFVILFLIIMIICFFYYLNYQKKRIKYIKAGKKWDGIVKELSKRK